MAEWTPELAATGWGNHGGMAATGRGQPQGEGNHRGLPLRESTVVGAGPRACPAPRVCPCVVK